MQGAELASRNPLEVTTELSCCCFTGNWWVTVILCFGSGGSTSLVWPLSLFDTPLGSLRPHQRTGSAVPGEAVCFMSSTCHGWAPRCLAASRVRWSLGPLSGPLRCLPVVDRGGSGVPAGTTTSVVRLGCWFQLKFKTPGFLPSPLVSLQPEQGQCRRRLRILSCLRPLRAQASRMRASTPPLSKRFPRAAPGGF